MMHFIFSDDVRRDPYHWYAQVREASPVLHDPRSGMWMLFDYESVKRAMDDHETFSSVVHPPTGRAPEWLVFLDPPRHSKLRAIVMRTFTPRAIAGLEPRIHELSRALLDEHLARGEMDLVDDYAGPLPVMVIAELIGIPIEDRPRFMRWSQAIVNLSYAIAGGAAAAQALREHAPARAEMLAYVTELAERRRLEPKDDLLTRLVEAEVDGERLSMEDILGFFQLLLSAATETTTNFIDNAVLSFIENPDQLARLRYNPDLLPWALEEVVRYRSPGQAMFRETTRDVEMHGRVIPAGSFVLVMVGSANRDPKRFANPEAFDIGRDPNPHIAFGHGIHFCIGAALARLEARVALTDLFSRMETIELASDEPWEPRKALHVHGPAHLPIRFTQRVREESLR
ncbi:MAG: cytochrome [Gemmatimonadetes bacterium]|nr:cytochrome [Gemmatimonadota bacterium]